MEKYLLKNTDNGRFVAKPGSEKSYTNSIKNARKFDTKAEAEKDRCVGNEIVVPLSSETD